jgi:cytochrome o ubiquinol oxidase subunit 2
MHARPTDLPLARATTGQVWRCAALTGTLGLASCGPSVLDPQGYVGTSDLQIMLDSLAIMLAIVVPVIIATVGVAWWFRASNVRARYRPDFVYSGSIELVVWSIPLMTILLLGGVAWVGSHDLDPAAPLPSKAPPLDVQVVSLDWKWLFIYPDQDVASVNHLVVPVGTPVHFQLTSASVMNAFFVPQLGSMIYTMPGMADRLNLIADHPGTYYGESAMISGDGFATMHFNVDAVSADQFNAWVTQAKSSGPALDTPAYGDLSKQSANVKPFTYRNVEPDLFRKIVTQDIPPAPGPASPPTPGSSGHTAGD